MGSPTFLRAQSRRPCHPHPPPMSLRPPCHRHHSRRPHHAAHPARHPCLESRLLHQCHFHRHQHCHRRHLPRRLQRRLQCRLVIHDHCLHLQYRLLLHAHRRRAHLLPHHTCRPRHQFQQSHRLSPATLTRHPYAPPSPPIHHPHKRSFLALHPQPQPSRSTPTRPCCRHELTRPHRLLFLCRHRTHDRPRLRRHCRHSLSSSFHQRG